MNDSNATGGELIVYDATLRDGTQGEGFNLSLEDKIAIARALDGHHRPVRTRTCPRTRKARPFAPRLAPREKQRRAGRAKQELPPRLPPVGR